MPRKPRFVLPGVPVHVVQRGNNRQAVFFDDNDYRVYLDWLGAAAGEHGCAIRAYVLMTNHIHLPMTPTEAEAISATLQALGRRFVLCVNRCYGRTGTLWESRFRASAVQQEDYLLACHRCIELNPVRAGMVEKPEDYPWSSYRANALGARDSVLTPHPLYRSYGNEAPERQAAYRKLFETHLDPDLVRNLRACLQTGIPLGKDRFRTQIEQALGVRVGYSTRRRPKKPPVGAASDADQLNMDF